MFSTDKVCERREKLKNYYVQLKLLKILSDKGISPKIFDIVMDWVKDFFTVKESISTPQQFRTYDTLMKHIKKPILIFLVVLQKQKVFKRKMLVLLLMDVVF